MRNGGIEINDAGSGDIDIVFCYDGNYSSHTVTWAEAEVMAKLLVEAAAKHKHHSLYKQKCDVLNALNDHERDIALMDGGKAQGAGMASENNNIRRARYRPSRRYLLGAAEGEGMMKVGVK